MTPERFRQIEELYHAVREKTGAERAALLARAGPELRREIEALLEQPDSGQFLDRSVPGNMADLGDSTVTVLLPGACLGPYRIEGKLGEGGMGEVFRAVDTRLGRAVAIKTARENFDARFEREARVISSLNHPNICTLYDVGPNYLVMELVEGETIAARLKHGPLSRKTALLYASQIAAALTEAHTKGVTHRDLKPANIMIAKSGVKVLDFGLAKSGADETVTASRMVLGTPAYMAPEQRGGQPADARSDLYSFGCVLYEMLTGGRVGARRARIRPHGLEKIVDQCLEEDPGRRLQSAAQLQDKLARAASQPSPWKFATVAAILVISAGAYYLHRAPKLTGQDIMVLADFANTTGDPVFDGTLRQGLAIQLEQSPFLKIMDDAEVQQGLRLMGLRQGQRVTNQIAHDICVRGGAAATIDGAIASFGRDYVITLEAITCDGGATLAREQVKASDKEHVLAELATAATAMRARLGESLTSIQKSTPPLDQQAIPGSVLRATTPSLEALQAYTAGYAELGQGHFLTSVPWFERAIALDPNFAMADMGLAVAFDNAGDSARSREYVGRAFALVHRISAYERDYITTYYYGFNGELDKAIEADRLAIRNYPRDWGFANDLSVNSLDLGQFEEGLEMAEEAARRETHAEPPYRRLLDAYLCLDRLADAKALAPKVRALGIDGARIHQRFLEMAYIEDDQAAAAREIQWYAGKPVEYLSFGLQAAYRNVLGQRRESSKLYQQAAQSVLRQGLKEAAAEFEEADARADALSGNCRTAQRLGRPALALAMCGDSARAERLAAETSKVFPNGTIWNTVQLPEIRAAIELHLDHPGAAIELLASAEPYERAYPEVPYLRGLAYLRLKKGGDAAAEFRKVVDHKGVNWGATWRHPDWGQYYSLAHLGLARAYVLAGDAAQAGKTFEKFFQLWKDADTDVSVLAEAKKDYKALQNVRHGRT